jgi:hypothetical protein
MLSLRMIAALAVPDRPRTDGAVATWPTSALAQCVTSPIEGAIRHACNSKTS